MTFLNVNRAALSVMMAVAWSAPKASAFIPEGSLDRVGAIYKNVRTVMAPVAGGNTPEGQARQLSDSLTTRCFTECIEENLSPKECQDYIGATIAAAGGHEVGDVQVKIQVPRTPEQLASSYWMVEVPVNIFGEFTCDRNEGQTFYPFKWDDGSDSGVAVENVDCQGLSAGECCLAIREYGKSLTTSGYDANGQCLACFAHQEALIPIVNESTGATDYLDYSYNDPSCIQEQLSGGEVDALDGITADKIASAMDTLQYYSGGNISCDEFPQLLSDLYDAAVVIHPLSQLVGQLACSVCYGDNDQEQSVVDQLIGNILNMLAQAAPPRSKENCIIIYTNEDGDIVDAPKLGGSRADDPFDAECEDGDEVDPTDPNAGPNCNNDPALACGDNQYCNFQEDNGYACKDYVGAGDSCGGFTVFGEDSRCNPDLAFCYDGTICYSNLADAPGQCVNYGANTCSNGADNDCNADEWCDVSEGRCKPNVAEDECCEEHISNCGFGADAGTLTCVEQYFYFPGISEWTCQPVCSGDDDCDDGHWCTSEGQSSARFCKPFADTDSRCNFYAQGPSFQEQCNPATHFCQDTEFCTIPDAGGQCTLLGNICGSDAECDDEGTEYCDNLAGFCKPKVGVMDCCDLNEESMCGGSTVCSTGDDTNVDFGGTALCRPPGSDGNVGQLCFGAGDCEDNQYCNFSEVTGVSTCKDYVGESGQCDQVSIPGADSRCSPGLSCELVPTADTLGDTICVANDGPPSSGSNCNNDASLACGDSQYCYLSESTGYVCNDYVGESGQCDQVSIPGADRRCSPELSCELVPTTDTLGDTICVANDGPGGPGINPAPKCSQVVCDDSQYCTQFSKQNSGVASCLDFVGLGESCDQTASLAGDRRCGPELFCASVVAPDIGEQFFCIEDPNGTGKQTCNENPTLCDDNQYCNFSHENGNTCADYVELGGKCTGASERTVPGEELRCGPEGTCAPEYDPESYQEIFTCKPSCSGDEDCDDAFCAFATYEERSGRFCKPYSSTGGGCDFYPAGPAYEGRCNSETHYCRDTEYCVVADGGGQCQPFRNACTSTADCDDPAIEWCDTGVGYCKAKLEADQCCIDGNDSMCGDGTVCSKGEEHKKPHTRRLRHNISGVDRDLIDYSNFRGVPLCRAPGGIVLLPKCIDDPQQCGGFAGFQCDCACGEHGNSAPICVDDPADNCDPKNGGADCIGTCQCPE